VVFSVILPKKAAHGLAHDKTIKHHGAVGLSPDWSHANVRYFNIQQTEKAYENGTCAASDRMMK